jgi:hypothetical protein
MNARDVLIEFLLANIEPEVLINFKASEEVHDHVYDLIDREKMGLATLADKNQLDQFMELEHLMRVVKAKARQYVPQQ